MAGLEVLGQHQDPDRLPELGADLPGCRESLDGVGRRHPHVDERDVRPERSHRFEQRIPVSHLRDDVEALQSEQLGHSCAQQRVVLGQHYAHGRSTSIRVPPP